MDYEQTTDYKRLYEELLTSHSELESENAALRSEVRELRMDKAPLSNNGYRQLVNLQLTNKALTERVAAFESGEIYVRIKDDHQRQLAAGEREIKKLKRELAEAHRQTVNVRNNWFRVFGDIENEQTRVRIEANRKIEALNKRIYALQDSNDAKNERYRAVMKDLYAVKVELEEEKEKNRKLKAQINRDHENSSKPSSADPFRKKKITNNREKTGKKPGGQPNHKSHPRKKQDPTKKVFLPTPEEYLDTKRYTPVGTVTKQMVGIRVVLDVVEYSAEVFRDKVTGTRVHAGFPDGVVNEVNYDGSVRAFAFLLNNHCNVSVAKVSDFLSDLTGGRLKISTGMINGLSKVFSLKTEKEQRKAFADLLLSPVMNVDFTTARVNGKNQNITVCTTPDIVMYFATKHKGTKGVIGTPIEDFLHTLIHDHEITFYNYGGNHQECIEHILRYLKDSMENEPGLKWNRLMRLLLQEMIHFRKHLDPKDNRNPDKIDPEKVKELERRYDKILALAAKEYEYEPPSQYYKEGFNLHLRLLKYKKYHLLFLHDRRVPYDNNLAERRARVVKRKGAQVMTFRSDEGLHFFCTSLGSIEQMRSQGLNMFETVSSFFDRVVKSDAAV